MTPRIFIACFLDVLSGYGQMNCGFINGFQKAGIATTIFATGKSTKLASLPSHIDDCTTKTPEARPIFLIQPPTHKPNPLYTKRVWFVLWESTKIDPLWAKRMTESAAIVTASDWNVEHYKKCGVNSPIHKIPLFLPTAYPLTPRQHKSEFVFGCSANIAGQGPRKNIEAAIEAFKKAFPKEKDVVLRIKIGDKNYLEDPCDSRIQLVKAYYTPAQMQQWYTDIDVFVHPSKAEGFGFQPLQAMSLGRAVIACRYGGVAEYFDSSVGLEVDYVEGPADELYAGTGNWANLDVNDLADKMRYAYSHAEEMDKLGLEGAERAKRFTLENTMKELIPLLTQYGIIVS